MKRLIIATIVIVFTVSCAGPEYRDRPVSRSGCYNSCPTVSYRTARTPEQDAIDALSIFLDIALMVNGHRPLPNRCW